MSVNVQVKLKTGEVIEIDTAEKKVEKDGRRTFTFERGKDAEEELEALKEVLERNTYGGK